MNQYSYDFLDSRIINQHQETIKKVIGKKLKNVKRGFSMSIKEFTEDFGHVPSKYFLECSGAIQFDFEKDFSLCFDIYGEKMSIILLSDKLKSSTWMEVHSFNSSKIPTPLLVSKIIGLKCIDVRIWKFSDSINSDEPKLAGISFVFSNAMEIVYSIYIHGESDSDLLTSTDLLDSGKIEYFYSLKEDRFCYFKNK